MKKKKPLADIGTVLHKIKDQVALKPWADYMAGIEPWKSLELTAEKLTESWSSQAANLLFFSAADPRNAKIGGFDHEHGLIILRPGSSRAFIEEKLKGPLPSGLDDGGYVQSIATKVRHKGVGKYLLLAAERVISEKYKRVYLFVSESNVAAQRFYKSAGYEQIAKATDCLKDGNTELLFTKLLET